MKSVRPAVGALAAACLFAAAPASLQPGLEARDEVLAAAFPGADIASDRVWLTEEQAERIAELSGEDLPTKIYARYVARQGGAVAGRAYVETHVVRTKNESLLVLLNPDGSVRRIAVLAFQEPMEYLAPEPWLRQYLDRSLDDDLQIQRAIAPITGATLTVRAVNAAVRRILALDRVLAEGE